MHRHAHRGLIEGAGDLGTDAPGDGVVLDDRDPTGAPGQVDDPFGDGEHPAGVDDEGGVALGRELLGDGRRGPGHGADRHDEHLGVVHRVAGKDVEALGRRDGLDGVGDAPLREADDRRRVRHVDGLAQGAADLLPVAGRGQA